MPLFAQLLVTALWVPLAITPPATSFAQLRVQPPEAAPASAPPPPGAVQPSPMAPAPVAAPTVVAPAGTTVVVPEGTATTVVTPAPIESVSTTTTTSAGVSTTTTVTTAPPAPTISPKAAVKTLLRYDPYLAPRYRSGRNMIIGGAVMLGVGGFTLLTTLSWAAQSREKVRLASDDDRDRLADRRNQQILTAQIVGTVAAAVVVTGVVLLAVGAVRKRRAIEEARGRVFMQAGPGGMQVRF